MRQNAIVSLQYFSALILMVMVQSCTKKPAENKNASPSALESLQKAVEASPNYVNYINLGLEYGRQQKSDEALAAYNKAIAINPTAPLGWNNICAELIARQKYVESLTYCEKALMLEPNFQLALNNLKYAQSKLDGQRGDFEKRKTEMLANPAASGGDLINLGMNFYSLKDYNASIDLWKKVKKGDALYASAQNNIASSYILLKDFAKADRALKEALALDPKNPNYLSNKKWLEEEKAKK